MDCLQYCQSAYQPINSSLADFSQPAVTASLSSLPFRSADVPSDLRQRDLVGVCVALDVEDEGVFVGVMLDDVIVHVHQDPDTHTKKTLSLHVHNTRLQIGLKLQSASSLTLFYSSCTLWLSSLWARHTSPISMSDKWKRFVNRRSAANKLCLWLLHVIAKASLTASIRPRSVGDFSIRASNTSSISFLTYNSTAERGGGTNLQLLATILVYILYTLERI